jgi:hypothetical protein
VAAVAAAAAAHPTQMYVLGQIFPVVEVAAAAAVEEEEAAEAGVVVVVVLLRLQRPRMMQSGLGPFDHV